MTFDEQNAILASDNPADERYQPSELLMHTCPTSLALFRLGVSAKTAAEIHARRCLDLQQRLINAMREATPPTFRIV